MKFNQLLIQMLLSTAIAASFVSCSTLAPFNNHATTLQTKTVWDNNSAIIWASLQQQSPTSLAELQAKTDDPNKKAWIQLALISKRKNVSTSSLANELMAWRQGNPSHPANQLIPSDSVLIQLKSSPPPHHIAILLPQSGVYASSGQSIREGFLHSYYANLSQVEKQTIKFYDTSSTSNMGALYQQALADGADFVIGPLMKENVSQLSASTKFTAPTLALNYTSSSFFSSRPTNFYEFGLLPEDEITQIATHARQSGVSRAIVIAPENAQGMRLVSAFNARWKALGGTVQSGFYYPKQTDFNMDIPRLLNVNPNVDKKLMQKNNNKEILAQQRRQDFDVIFIFSPSQEARQIVPLLRFYYADNVPVYGISEIRSTQSDANLDLKGVIVCDIPDKGSNRFYALGQDAYLLSQSMQSLENIPNFPLNGATGSLSMSAQQIHRQLLCAPINGLNS